MAVVGQFAGIETVAEHTFARGCNPERTVAVESDVCHHLDSFAFFAVLEQLLAFPVGSRRGRFRFGWPLPAGADKARCRG